MATGDLEWKGRAWPAAIVTEKMKVRTGERGTSRFACEIVTTGTGREYELHGAWGFWRNFSFLKADDEAAVLDFVRRRGCPFGDLGPDKPTDSGDWPSVSTSLEPLAVLWDPPDADGVSRISVEDKQRIAAIESLFTSLLSRQDIKFNIQIDGAGHIRTLMKANSLAGFMRASAMFHLQGKTEMSVCAQCGDWFGIQRQGTKFCSPSCRAAFSTRNKGAANG